MSRNKRVGKRRPYLQRLGSIASVACLVVGGGLVAASTASASTTGSVTGGITRPTCADPYVTPHAHNGTNQPVAIVVDGNFSANGTTVVPPNISIMLAPGADFTKKFGINPIPDYSSGGSLSLTANGKSLGTVNGNVIYGPCATNPPPTPTVNLSESASTIQVGQSSTLSWTSKGAISLTASGAWSGAKHVPSGSQTVTPSAAGSYKYVLTTDHSTMGQGTDSVTLVVKKTTPPPTCQSKTLGAKGNVSLSNGVVTYSVSIPKPACAKLSLPGDTYLLPASYDGSGKFDASASPQYVLLGARVDLTIAKGAKSATATGTIRTSCGWIQPDVYTGAHQDVVTYPAGNHGNIVGHIYNLGSCTTPAPAEQKYSNGHTTPTCQVGTVSDTFTYVSGKGIVGVLLHRKTSANHVDASVRPGHSVTLKAFESVRKGQTVTYEVIVDKGGHTKALRPYTVTRPKDCASPSPTPKPTPTHSPKPTPSPTQPVSSPSTTPSQPVASPSPSHPATPPTQVANIISGQYPVQSPTSGSGVSFWQNNRILFGAALVLVGLIGWLAVRPKRERQLARQSH